MRYSIGLDIGGTKVAIGIISENGEIIDQFTVKSQVNKSEDMYASVKEAIKKLRTTTKIPWNLLEGIGIGVPGKVDTKNGVAVFQTNLPWRDFPLVERLKSDFYFDKIIIDNDVYIAAYAEWASANISSQELFAYITVSTGISSALIQSNHYLRGAGFAGELGQMPIYSPFDKSLTTLERAVSGLGLERNARNIYQTERITTQNLFKMYREKEPSAIQIIEKSAEILAQGVYTLVTLYDPHQIVLGGSVASYNPDYILLMKQKMERWLLPDQKHILQKINIGYYKNLSGLVGAGLRVFSNVEM